MADAVRAGLFLEAFPDSRASDQPGRFAVQIFSDNELVVPLAMPLITSGTIIHFRELNVTLLYSKNIFLNYCQ